MPVISKQYYLFVCALATLPGNPAWANNQDAIARCASISTTDDRILCLEDALRRGSGKSEQVPEVPISSTPAKRSVAPDAVQDIEKSSTAKVAPETSRDETTVSEPSAAKELGAEQLARKKSSSRESDVRITANVISIADTGIDVFATGRMRFTLDNGQTWQQTGDDDRNIRRKLKGAGYFPVEMWRSRTGGYRMYIPAIDRTVKVKRLK